MALKINCPVCKSPMKVINDHWVDPLLQCQTRNCSNAKHLHRVSKIKGDNPRAA